ncbi:uncharacterized protein TrAtP1_001707 [Trichoderma atroviride]|uniref:uncharacterized protein n=1 Tax=Hypocrea atroviridis TaxID=63577 RepID=UPI00331D840A|nr:hypothetical protein TrAtP1_001707 [Trichoderma atroviride]
MGDDDITIPDGHLDLDTDCSESVTQNISMWLRGMDGYPASEQSIWDSDEKSVAPEGGRHIGHQATHRSLAISRNDNTEQHIMAPG